MILSGKDMIGLKKLTVLFALLLCLSMLSGCGNKLAEGYDEQTIKDTAEQIITDIHVKGVTEVLTPLMREDYLKKYPMENMEEQVLELLVGVGNFMAYGQESVIGKESPDIEGEQLAVILVTALYEKGEINYTLTFDKDMKVLSFYAK